MENITPEEVNGPQAPQGTSTTKSSRLKIAIAVGITAILTAIIVGTSMFLWQQRIAENNQEKLQQEITELKNKQSLASSPETSPASSVGVQPTASPISTSGWKTMVAQGIEFQYPEKLETQFINPNEWPPTIKVTSGMYSCMQSTDGKGTSNQMAIT